MGYIKAVCISDKKGEQKYQVPYLDLIINHGVKGDAHAGAWHRQVSLLAEESVNKLRQIKDIDIKPGAFAENILTNGLKLHSIAVGEEMAIGTAICRVTQIGKECHNGCAIRDTVGECIMPEEGVFVEVIKEGRAAPGDKVELLWEQCTAFHGHSCGGLLIGYKAAIYAMELMEIERSEDEEIVCVAENDACGIDAIQYILGCTSGKGNLFFDIRGKQAFNFYNRRTGEAKRLMFKAQGGSFEERKAMGVQELFDVSEPSIELPKEASIYKSRHCRECGEITALPYMVEKNGESVCLECAGKK